MNSANNLYCTIMTCLLYPDERVVDACKSGAAAERHSKFQFGAQQFEDMMHAFGSIDCQAPDDGTANEDSSGSQREGLEDVSAAPDAAIDIDFAAARCGGNNLGEGFDAGNGAVE